MTDNGKCCTKKDTDAEVELNDEVRDLMRTLGVSLNHLADEAAALNSRLEPCLRQATPPEETDSKAYPTPMCPIGETLHAMNLQVLEITQNVADTRERVCL